MGDLKGNQIWDADGPADAGDCGSVEAQERLETTIR